MCPVHGAQESQLGVSVRQTLTGERESGGVSQGERQPEPCRELLDASPQRPTLLPAFLLREVRQLQSDHDRRRRAEPPSRRRARATEIRGDGQVPGAWDKIPEPRVIAWLRAGGGRHADDHRPFAEAAQLLKADAASIGALST